MSVNVNCPFQVRIAMDGTVSIATQASVDYNLSTPDVVFQGILTDDILRAFEVSVGAEGTRRIHVDLLAGEADEFVASVCQMLALAPIDAAAEDHVHLKKYLLKFAKDALLAQLKSSGVNDAMEQGALDDIALPNFETDICDGAVAMKDGINALNPDTRALFFTQIGNSKLMTRWGTDGFGGSQETVSASLPLGPDDKLTMQFIITQTYEVSESEYDSSNIVNITGGDGTAVFGSDPSVAPVLGNYGVSQRIVNIVLTRMNPDQHLGLNGADMLKGTEMAVPAELAGPDDAPYSIAGKKAAYEAELLAAKNAYSTWQTANLAYAKNVAAQKDKDEANSVLGLAATARDAAKIAAESSPGNSGLQAEAVRTASAWKTAYDYHAGIVVPVGPAPGAVPTNSVNTLFGVWGGAVIDYNEDLAERNQDIAAATWHNLMVAQAKLSADYELECQTARAGLAFTALGVAKGAFDLLRTAVSTADTAVNTAATSADLSESGEDGTSAALLTAARGAVKDANDAYISARTTFNAARVVINHVSTGAIAVYNAAKTAQYDASQKTDDPEGSVPAVEPYQGDFVSAYDDGERGQMTNFTW